MLYYPQTMKKRIRRVAVALMLSNPAGPRKFAGISAFVGGSARRWDLHVLRSQGDISAFFANADALSGIDGVIYSGLYDPEVFRVLAGLKCPVVVMESDAPEFSRYGKNVAVVRNDADEIARCAVKTFTAAGRYRSFAFVGDGNDSDWSKRREDAFRKAVAASGLGKVAVYGLKDSGAGRKAKVRPISEFLSSLDYPAAILAAYDTAAAEVIDAAASVRLAVPGQVSVLGIDSDPYICDSISPTLSSIEPDHYAEGKAAARLLDQMMEGRAPRGGRCVSFGVKRVVLRESTAHLPMSGDIVARAKRYIERHAVEGIAPGDVAAHLGISRSLLDLRFRETQKTTVMRLITGTKLAAVARHLRETRIALDAIADLCGFDNKNSLRNIFKARFGVSMHAYRSSRSRQAFPSVIPPGGT